jgi:hypothetical protein
VTDITEPAGTGPAIPDGIVEVEGIFPTDAALQDAVGRLTEAGFDRADLSLPDARPTPSEATPEQGAGSVTTDSDVRQARALGTGLAASAAGMAAAGAVVATGGAAALAVAAAAAAGVGAGVLAEAAGTAATSAGRTARDAAASRNELVLSARTIDAERQARAQSIMAAAGATRVASVRRTNGGIVVS